MYLQLAPNRIHADQHYVMVEDDELDEFLEKFVTYYKKIYNEPLVRNDFPKSSRFGVYDALYGYTREGESYEEWRFAVAISSKREAVPDFEGFTEHKDLIWIKEPDF